MITVTKLFSYPVKSMGAVSHQTAYCHARGMEYDRSWMIIDENGKFLTQRELPKMALVQPEIITKNGIFEGLQLRYEADTISIEAAVATGLANPSIITKVWDDTVQVQAINGPINTWISEILGQKVQLVYLPTSNLRLVDERYRKNANDSTSLSDGYPYLIVSEASLQLLEQKVGAKIDIRRFRPNIVVTGCTAHAEDTWGGIMADGVSFFGVKPCARCPIPNIDPNTGQKILPVLKSLSSYRMINHKVYFGQNLVISATGLLSVGNQLTISHV
jgi:uncharacterized protein